MVCFGNNQGIFCAKVDFLSMRPKLGDEIDSLQGLYAIRTRLKNALLLCSDLNIIIIIAI